MWYRTEEVFKVDIDLLMEVRYNWLAAAGRERSRWLTKVCTPGALGLSGTRKRWPFWGRMPPSKESLQPLKRHKKRQKEWGTTKKQATIPVSLHVVRETQRISRLDFKPYQDNTGDVAGFFHQDFEHQCELPGVPPADWTRHVVGLHGGVPEAYRMMDPLKKRGYEDL